MTGFDSKRKAALDEDGMYLVHHTKRKDDDDDAQGYIAEYESALQKEYQRGYEAGKAAQPAQEPVAYDKTEINKFVQDLYDKKMQEGKHGHYETMFHVVHQAIKRVSPPAAQPEQEQNFCPRCGKRTQDIHTCTPPDA